VLSADELLEIASAIPAGGRIDLETYLRIAREADRTVRDRVARDTAEAAAARQEYADAVYGSVAGIVNAIGSAIDSVVSFDAGAVLERFSEDTAERQSAATKLAAARHGQLARREAQSRRAEHEAALAGERRIRRAASLIQARKRGATARSNFAALVKTTRIESRARAAEAKSLNRRRLEQSHQRGSFSATTTPRGSSVGGAAKRF